MRYVYVRHQAIKFSFARHRNLNQGVAGNFAFRGLCHFSSLTVEIWKALMGHSLYYSRF